MIPVTSIDWAHESLLRGGILPLTLHAGAIHVCVGVNRTGCLTTIGGTYDAQSDFNLLNTVVREFHEETSGVLFPLSMVDLMGDVCLVVDGYVLILHFTLSPVDVIETCNNEIKFLLWLRAEKFLSMKKNLAYDVRLFMDSLSCILSRKCAPPLTDSASRILTSGCFSMRRKESPAPTVIQLTPDVLTELKAYIRPWQKRFLAAAFSLSHSCTRYILRLLGDERNRFYCSHNLDAVAELLRECRMEKQQPLLVIQEVLPSQEDAVTTILRYEQNDKERYTRSRQCE
jgi:hypothetical protein